jgi:hypothetical protein
MTENESILSVARPETRLQKSIKSIRGSVRWVLVVAAAFALGGLLIALALYIPNNQKLNKANATIFEKTDQITTLSNGNKTLIKNLDTASLHMYVLKALSGVRGASLAVAADDYAGARLSLIQASEALNTLSGLLGTDQKDVFNAMQQNTAKALTEVKADLKSAQPDLDLLTKNLLQLEANLFPNP